MELSQPELAAIVREATQELKSQLLKNLTVKLESEVTFAASNLVREHVQEWVKENVLPDVTAILFAGKLSLVNAASQAAELMCAELAKAMAESFSEKLNNSWSRKRLVTSLFGD